MNTTAFRHLLFLAVAFFLVAAAPAGRAQVVVYDNLGSAPYDDDGYTTFGLYSDGNRYESGMQFTPSQTITLSTLELALGEAFFTSGNPAQSGTAEARIMTDTNNAPATVLESWTSGAISGFPSGASVQTFTSLQTPTLVAGSNYWIMLSAPSGSNLGGAWFFADDQHTGNTLTVGIADSTGTSYYSMLIRGYRTRVTGISTVLPSLSIARTATNTIVVSWPAPATGWVLQSTNSFTPATNQWPQVTLPYSSTATNFFVTITNLPAAGSQFFRLYKP
jgi:hypothetical protein